MFNLHLERSSHPGSRAQGGLGQQRPKTGTRKEPLISVRRKDDDESVTYGREDGDGEGGRLES